MGDTVAFDRDPELGEESVMIANELESQPGHGWRDLNAVNEPLLLVVERDHIGITNGPTGPLFQEKDGTVRNLPRSVAETACVDKEMWEKLKHGKPAYFLEFMAELDRMLSSLCLHREWILSHNHIGRRIVHRVQLLGVFHLLFVGAMYCAYFAGYVDGRPRSIGTFVLCAETGWYVSQTLLKIWEWYEHDKRAPGAFCFKLDFQNLPALKELAGEQKWKDMQECSDESRVLEDLTGIFNDAVSSSLQSQTAPSPTQC